MRRISAHPVSSFPFVILISILVLAGASSTPVISQLDVLSVAREPYPGLSRAFFSLPGFGLALDYFWSAGDPSAGSPRLVI